MIKFLYEYHAEDVLLNLAINEHCLPALKGIYEDFKKHFTCKPVDEQFKNFVGIS